MQDQRRPVGAYADHVGTGWTDMAGHAPHSGTQPQDGPASGIPASGVPATRRERPPFRPGHLSSG